MNIPWFIAFLILSMAHGMICHLTALTRLRAEHIIKGSNNLRANSERLSNAGWFMVIALIILSVINYQASKSTFAGFGTLFFPISYAIFAGTGCYILRTIIFPSFFKLDPDDWSEGDSRILEQRRRQMRIDQGDDFDEDDLTPDQKPFDKDDY